jgi:hypothetical protein
MSLPGDTNDFFEGMTHCIDEDNKKGTFFQTMNNPMACFSKIYDDMAMWAYYADKHTGLCFEVEVSDSKKIDRYEVLYTDEPLITQINSLENPMFPGHVDAKVPEEILYTKKKQWSHEKEIRYVDSNYFHDSESPQIRYFYYNKLISIIIGIMDLCKKFKISLYRIVPNFIEYRLERVLIQIK